MREKFQPRFSRFFHRAITMAQKDLVTANYTAFLLNTNHHVASPWTNIYNICVIAKLKLIKFILYIFIQHVLFFNKCDELKEKIISHKNKRKKATTSVRFGWVYENNFIGNDTARAAHTYMRIRICIAFYSKECICMWQRIKDVFIIMIYGFGVCIFINYDVRRRRDDGLSPNTHRWEDESNI